MAIDLTDTAPRIQYSVGVTSTTVFAVPFVFFDDTDLLVYDDATLRTITTDYTVTGGDGTTGTVTLNVGVTDTTITIVRDIPIARAATASFPLTGPFNIEALNTELAKLAAWMQQLETKLARALVKSDTDTDGSLELPLVEDRKGLFMGFDATTGEPTAVSGTSGDLTVVTTFMNTMLGASTAAAARTLLALGTASVKNTGTSGDAIPLLNAQATFSSALAAGGPFFVGSSIDATISANTDDWAPTGVGTCNTIRCNCTTNSNLTGLTSGSSGKIMVIHNVGTGNLTLVDQSVSSTAANRFALPNGSNVTIDDQESCILHYDSSDSRWRLLGQGKA